MLFIGSSKRNYIVESIVPPVHPTFQIFIFKLDKDGKNPDDEYDHDFYHVISPNKNYPFLMRGFTCSRTFGSGCKYNRITRNVV